MGDKFPVRLIQTIDGQMVRSDFGPEVDVVEAMAVRGYAFTKYNANPSQRAELQGQPRFDGLNGPMWDGDAIRYEDPEAYARLTDAVPATMQRALARVIEAEPGATVALNFLILEGEHTGARFAVPRGMEGRLANNLGVEVRVKFTPDDQYAYLDPVLTPSDCRPEAPFPRNRYEEKVEAKRERYAERAQKARGESASRFAAANRIMDGIPMGQPILVGHHSERHHRRDLARIDTNLRKGIEEADKAAHYEHKAKTYGTHGVSSDDPGAVAKLKAQLKEREATRELEKTINRKLKAAAKSRAKELGRDLKQSDHVELIGKLASEIPAALAKQLLSYAQAFPWLPQFGNHTQADVKRIEKRIAELERNASVNREPLKGEIADDTGRMMGYTVEWNTADNRVQIYFPFRPGDTLVAKLKARGFKWARSVNAWQRQASESAWYHARQIVGHKEPTVETVEATITKCPDCDKPTHASESDDEGRCMPCANAAIEHIPGCAHDHCTHYECGPSHGWCEPCKELDNG